MSVLEGHGNVVMDDLGREHVAGAGAHVARAPRNARKTGGLTGACTSCSASSRRCGSTRSASASCAASYEIGGRRRVRRRVADPRTSRRSSELDEPARWLGRVERSRTRCDRLGTAPARSPSCGRSARSMTSAARRRRVSAAAPTRSRCSRSRARPASSVSRCTSITACAPVPARRRRPSPRPRRASVREFRACARRRSPPVPNLEARARDARYAALEARAGRARRADAILVAHTRDDQAETVLLNCCGARRRAGWRGWPARRGYVRRPLLGVPAARDARALRAAGARAGRTTR